MNNIFRLLPLALCATGCAATAPVASTPASAPAPAPVQAQTLARARQSFKTQIVPVAADKTPAETPPADLMKLIKYPAPVGQLSAYLTNAPKMAKSIRPSCGLPAAITIRLAMSGRPTRPTTIKARRSSSASAS